MKAHFIRDNIKKTLDIGNNRYEIWGDWDESDLIELKDGSIVGLGEISFDGMAGEDVYVLKIVDDEGHSHNITDEWLDKMKMSDRMDIVKRMDDLSGYNLESAKNYII